MVGHREAATSLRKRWLKAHFDTRPRSECNRAEVQLWDDIKPAFVY